MNLARIQALSVATKIVTTILGIVQSIIIIRILSPTEFGLIGLVMSIGGVIGVSQHLGIVDGAIREIAVRKNKDEIGKVFWVSHLARQAVTLPLSLALALLASVIATKVYNRPEIVPFIQLFAGVLILQGLQDVLGATLTGMKKFVSLYVIQIITATVNIVVFGLLTWQYHIAGFFWAIIATTLLMIILIAVIIARELAGHLVLPSVQEIKKYGKNLLHISAYMYVSRIFYVIWQRLPILVLGGLITGDQLGYLNISLTFGSKLIILAAALSEVNLSWMSTLFATAREEFARVASKNMHRVFILMAGLTAMLIFFIPEILHIVIKKPAYFAATPYIVIMTLAFFLYSLIDIGTSSIFVPANKPNMRALIFGIMTFISAIGSIVAYYSGGNMLIAIFTMAASAVVAYIAMVSVVYKSFSITLVPMRLWALLACLSLAGAFLLTTPALWARIVVFIALMLIIVHEAYNNYLSSITPNTSPSNIRIICFAGALYDQASWTNRQHIMARLANKHPVLYIEPRVWIVRYIFQHLLQPKTLAKFLMRLFGYEKKHDNLYIKSQWNILPWSREIKAISRLNHALNKHAVLGIAEKLGFLHANTVLWLYDTEAAEYLPAFKNATVIYDCVDNHAAQAGVNRNAQRVHTEERTILKRADLVTVTSKQLLKMKRKHAKNIRLVLNAGDVELYTQEISKESKAIAKQAMKNIAHPILGSVGALDSYKYDFDLLIQSATKHPTWNFVFVGSPIVDRKNKALKTLTKLPNIHMIGSIPREHVPAYVEYFDICLIPYKNNDYNAASFPLKFWEFMATGKPIIASGVPGLVEYNEYIGYANNEKEFAALVEQQLAASIGTGDARKKLAYKHGYNQRVKELEKLLIDATKQK